jgi:hypothetical protein
MLLVSKWRERPKSSTVSGSSFVADKSFCEQGPDDCSLSDEIGFMTVVAVFSTLLTIVLR